MKFCPVCQSEYDDSAENCPADGARLVSTGVASTEHDPLEGVMFTDRIRIDKRIGEGGMGAVYRGEDVLLGRTVAVKVLHASLKNRPEDVKRFFNEARVVARLRHPNTIQVFDFGESALTGHSYIAMEFMTGEPLDSFMRGQRLTLERILGICREVCLSLEEAHAAGIIHRDLKPDNIFIDNVAKGQIVKVIDFGIAKMVSGGDKLTQAGMVFGTPAYMSPEQARGDVLDARSDVYSLGVVLFHLLAGRTPFEGASPMEVAIQHITREPPDIGAIASHQPLPGAVRRLVRQMMAKDREDRPASVTDVRRDLDRILGGDYADPEPTAPYRATDGPAPSQSKPSPRTVTPEGFSLDDDAFAPRRSRVPLIGGLVAAAILAVGTLAFFSRGGGEGVGAEATAAATGEAETATAAAPAPQVPSTAAVVARAVDVVVAARGHASGLARSAVATIEIASTPSGATVMRGDTSTPLGTTPFVWRTLRASRDVNAHPLQQALADATPLHFRLEGHGDVEGSARMTVSSSAVSVVLVPSPTTTAEVRGPRTPRDPVPRDAAPRDPAPRDPTPAAADPPPSRGGRFGGDLRAPVTIPTDP